MLVFLGLAMTSGFLITPPQRGPGALKSSKGYKGFQPKAPVQKPQTTVDDEDRSFFAVYTCGRCNTKNSIKVRKLSWDEGLVVAKCYGCGAQHVLADNRGLMDKTNNTAFSNVYNDLLQQGKTPRAVQTTDPEILKELGVELLQDGNISLIPAQGDDVVAENLGRVKAIKGNLTEEPPLPPQTIRQGRPGKRRTVEEALAIEEKNYQERMKDIMKIQDEPVREMKDYEAEMAEQLMYQQQRDNFGGVSDEKVDPPTIVLPDNATPGGILTIKIADGRLVHLNLPEGSKPGLSLRVDGLIEVNNLPPNMNEGDYIKVHIPPSTDPVVIPLIGDDLKPDAIVNVGFPLSLSDEYGYFPIHDPSDTDTASSSSSSSD